MMNAIGTTPMIAPTNVQHASTNPAASGIRYVPVNRPLWPTIDPPIRPATAPIAARGATYPPIRLPVELGSDAIIGHSVVGVRQMFFTRSTMLMLLAPSA